MTNLTGMLWHESDIDVGQIVMVDEMYITNVHSQNETYCKTCLKSTMNFIPFRNCSDVMFCDDQCMASHNIHEMTCNALHGLTFNSIRIVESIVIAVTAFPNVATLMGFVESALVARDPDTPKCSSDAQSKYRSFLKLDISTDKIQEEIDRSVYHSYQLLLEIPEVKRRFQLKREKRFLMHLILQHECKSLDYAYSNRY